MATLELQQVKCPNCGAPITSFNEFKTQIECPYCHATLRNPSAIAVQKSMKQPERIIPFTTKEEDFGQHLVEGLIHRNYVPTDVFDNLHAEDTIKAYLPMFLFEGKYEASWSGQVTESYEDNGSTKKRSRYVNGNAFGNFSFICLAYDGNDIPEELKSFVATFPYSIDSTRIYDPTIIQNDPDKNLTTLPVNVDPEILWRRDCEAKAIDIADNGILQQTGSDVKNLQRTVAIDLTKRGALVLVPFWFVYYNYQQNKYYFMMDGSGKQEQLISPEDMDEKKEVKKFNWLIWVAAILSVIGAAFLIIKSNSETSRTEETGVGIAVVTFIVCVVLLISSIIFCLVRKKNILKESEAIRAAAAQRFLAGQG